MSKTENNFGSYTSNVGFISFFAVLIWLFGNLVFIPLADSVNWQTRVFITLIFFAVFTALVFASFSKIKHLADLGAVVLARKYFLKKGWNRDESIFVSKQILYSFFAVILYLLFLPFLGSFHFAVAGLALVVLVLWVLFAMMRIISVMSERIKSWLSS